MIQLQLHDIGKRFGAKTLFSHLNGTFSATKLAISGPNGSGKSTLMRIIAGLGSQSTGQIKWMDNQSELPKELVLSTLGFAAPYINLYDELTTTENLRFVLRSRSLPDEHSLIAETLEAVGLAHRADLAWKKLSSGQQQRLRLAAALIVKPKILMLDEPGTNLDTQGKQHLFDLLAMDRYRPDLLIIASNEPDELQFCTETLTLTPPAP